MPAPLPAARLRAARCQPSARLCPSGAEEEAFPAPAFSCPAAFAGMDASQQRHHSSLLPLMLGSGLHSAAAAHMRACLQGLGLQPG